MEFYSVLLGLILLILGRKLFWLFVAIAGFLVGLEFARVILADHARWVLILFGLGAGLVGALLAMLLERVAFALAGFFAGAYLALILGQSLGADRAGILFLAAGGVIGALIAAVIMDRAIILLSSLVGAGAVVEGLALGLRESWIVFVLLVIAGVLVQARLMNPARGGRNRRAAPP